MESVVSLRVFPLSVIGDGDEIVPIKAPEYEHREGFFPSRQIRVRINDNDVHVGIVEEVPKQKKGPHIPTTNVEGEDETKKKKYPYCLREEEIFVAFRRRTRILFLNQNNWRTKECWLGYHHHGDGICKNAEAIYERLRRLAISIATVFDTGLCEVRTSDDVTGPEAEPRYDASEPLDFPINQILMDVFDNDPGVQDLRKKVQRERGDQVAQRDESESESELELELELSEV